MLAERGGAGGNGVEQWISEHPDVLAYLQDKTLDFAVQASQTVPGILLKNFMEDPHQEWANILVPTLQESFLGSLLTVAEDLKPDNIMLGEVASRQFVMVGIDNDRSFASSVIRTPSEGCMIQAKNCLLAHPFILDQTLDPEVTSKLLIPPEFMLEAWFEGIHERHRAYTGMIETGAFFPSQEGTPVYTRLGIPLRFVPGTVTHLFKRLQSLQAYLRKYPQPTLRSLFFHVDPLLAEYYQNLCQRYVTPLERIRALYDPSSNLPYLAHMLPVHSLLRDGRTVQETLQEPHPAFNDFVDKRTQTWENAYRLFVETHQHHNPAFYTRGLPLLIDSLSEAILYKIFDALEPKDLSRMRQVNKRCYALISNRYETLYDDALKNLVITHPEHALRYLDGLVLSRKLKKEKANHVYGTINNQMITFESSSLPLLKRAAVWGSVGAQQKIDALIHHSLNQASELSHVQPLTNHHICQIETLFRQAFDLGHLTSLCSFVSWLYPQLPFFFKDPVYEGYSSKTLEEMLDAAETKALAGGCDSLLDLATVYQETSFRKNVKSAQKRFAALEQRLRALAHGAKDVSAFQKIVAWYQDHGMTAPARELVQQMSPYVQTVSDAWKLGSWFQQVYKDEKWTRFYYERAEALAERQFMKKSPQGYRELLLHHFQEGEDKAAIDPQGKGPYQNFVFFGEGKTSLWLSKIHEGVNKAPAEQKRIFLWWYLEDKPLRNPDKALELLESVAISGALQDRQYLAYLYSKPHDSMESVKYIPFDLGKAYAWYAHQNTPGAPSFGRSWESIKADLQAPPQPRDRNIVYLLGCELEKKGENFARMTSLYQEAADLGHADAMLRLGISALKFSQTPFTKHLAAQWYEKAACLGQIEAAYYLGKHYKESKDYFNARKWYERPAANGHREAQYELGMLLHEHVLEGARSLGESQEWLQKATDQGKKSAQKELSK